MLFIPLYIPQMILYRNITSRVAPKLQNSANEHSSKMNMATVLPGFLTQLLNLVHWIVWKRMVIVLFENLDQLIISLVPMEVCQVITFSGAHK